MFTCQTCIPYIWINAYKKDPSNLDPIEYGWQFEEGKYVCKWFEGDQLPSLVDMITQDSQEEANTEAVKKYRSVRIVGSQSVQKISEGKGAFEKFGPIRLRKAKKPNPVKLDTRNRELEAQSNSRQVQEENPPATTLRRGTSMTQVKSSVKMSKVIVIKTKPKMASIRGKVDSLSDKLRTHDKAKSPIALNRSLNSTNQTLSQEIDHFKSQAIENDRTIAQNVDKEQLQLVKNMETKLEYALSANEHQAKELEALKNKSESPVPSTSHASSRKRRKKKSPSNTSSGVNSETEIEEMGDESEIEIQTAQNPKEHFPQLRNPDHKNPLLSQSPELSIPRNQIPKKTSKPNETPDKPGVPP
ncbi:unnamed protein product [Ceutorhynchus assimilis]|uniref:Uncharacterized protein n=1 Tax=Ceutorhynchus assimilis TaxID=467358 RepID=A0A9N9MJT2_9CUCU|nr:unnamed protein product [Ceutorhynchus assimilis]